ncbi:DUF6325 family protein [Agromyces aerolatus]|uniref:DUF6325 family protein n=1 Tax=Agromyces sp. LY-1074 TaxID=3074080 RepID=UPI00285726C4|nr:MULTISPECIES: DUF6325 family protein [unclassified Agromyces]MDR5701090.1 DUF6325 family protein [Agromyces sp. LY-1074]MDR5707730.1 DUF6325 family protein [Agromyces sp. LY-1358]
MADFEYGPVEILVVGFEGERPDAPTFDAIADLVEAGDIRLLDAVIISRDADGNLDAIEFEDLGDEVDVTEIELEASGLVGEDDYADLGQVIPPGTSAAILAVELVWAKHLASRFAESGGVMLHAERIPAPVVNAVLAEASAEESA